MFAVIQEPSSKVAPSPNESAPELVPMPSSSWPSSPTHPLSTSNLTPLVADERAIAALLTALLSSSGLSLSEASRRMGVNVAGIRQYLHGRHPRPGIFWFLRFVSVCGAQVSISFPKRG